MSVSNFSQQRKAIADIYRPQGVKKIGSISGLTGAAPAAVTSDLNGQVDLTKPIRGLRFVVKGRVGVATAAYTSVNPENLLNLISKILVTGGNSLTGGDVTLFSMDMATLWNLANTTRGCGASIRVNGTEAVRPTVAYSIAGNNGTALVGLGVGNFDFIITFDVPFAPFAPIGALATAGFAVRGSEWPNGLNIHIEFPAIADNAANALGTSAATTVTTISAINSGSGKMTVDVFSLPVIFGSTRNSFTPGILTRTATTINSALLQNSGDGVNLLNLQKKATSRVYVKIGTGAASPVFTALSDSIVTALGLQIGTDVNVRNVLDIEAVRFSNAENYGVYPVQGYYILDFVQSGNFDAAYPGDELDGASTVNLVANVTLNATGQGLVVQEQIIQHPQGPLFG